MRAQPVAERPDSPSRSPVLSVPTVGQSEPSGFAALALRFSLNTAQITATTIGPVITVPFTQFHNVSEPGRITISYQTPATRMLTIASGTRYFHAKFISRSTRIR